jgi:hypothetical protein
MTIVSLNTLNKGMTGDPRDRSGSFRVMKHFNNEQAHKLTPYYDMELDAITESTLDVFQITRIVKAANGKYYGFGQISDVNTKAQVYIKTTATDPTAVWTTASSGSDASFGGARNDLFFLAYHNYLYGGNSTGIWKYGDITGTPSFTYNENTAIFATAQGLVHSKDDIMYVPCTVSGVPYIAKNNSGSWNNTALQLPSTATNVSIFEDGNYLGIAGNLGNGDSFIYLWDRDSSLVTLAETINWGTGTLVHAESLGGVIVGVSVLNSLIPRVLIQYWNGSEVVPFANFQCSLATVGTWKQKFDNALLFLAELTIDGQAHKGLWKLAKTPTGLSFTLDRLPRNDTALNAGSLKGFYRTGDYVFVAYLNPADSKYTIWRTNDQVSYTATSVVETTINQGMPEADRTVNKQLEAVSISFESLPSGAQGVLKYRVDGGAWTTILTEATDGVITAEQVMDASGTEFTFGREYEFHAESTGGAEITELKYKYKVLSTLI